MNKNDEIFDKITDRQLQLLRLDASLRQDILKELKKLEKEIVSKLSNDLLENSRLKVFLKEVRSLIKETYETINKDMIDNITDFVDIETTFMTKTLIAVEVSAVDFSIPKVKNLVKGFLISGAPSEEWWSRQSEKLVQNFEDQLRMGVLLGESNQKLIQRIRGTRDFNYTNGIMNVSRNDAEALVRSSVQNAANQARFEVMESVSNLIQSYRQVSTLDSRTSIVCAVRDGKRWEAQTKNPIDHNLPFQVPPLHWNCRSTLISEIKGVELVNATRASKDGPVASTLTFEEYLKGKSEAFVNEVLGEGRAKLWKEGKITFRQLLDQSGNPLTLKELRSKYT